MQILPISAVVPTYNRASSFRDTLVSLCQQDVFPSELIVVDASQDSATREMLYAFSQRVAKGYSIRWIPAEICGAAAQRNQGVATATQPFIWFFDDDIVFEPECVSRLWHALQSEPRLGGANAMIVNQRYQQPGCVSRILFTVMHGRHEDSFAGRVIGPAVNLLPEDRDDLPDVVPVEWLNTTCTLYRRGALPSPPFDSIFTGYSLMEDLTLSLCVGQQWKLANVRTARIYHDSQPADYKDNKSVLAKMELINRHYVMTRILERCHPTDYIRLLLFEIFGMSTALITVGGWKRLPAVLFGKAAAVWAIIAK